MCIVLHYYPLFIVNICIHSLISIFTTFTSKKYQKKKKKSQRNFSNPTEINQNLFKHIVYMYKDQVPNRGHCMVICLAPLVFFYLDLIDWAIIQYPKSVYTIFCTVCTISLKVVWSINTDFVMYTVYSLTPLSTVYIYRFQLL